METEMIAPLVKNTLVKSTLNHSAETSECCGGTPTSNADACCKLDEEKKAEGAAGCGCNSSPATTAKSSCC